MNERPPLSQILGRISANHRGGLTVHDRRMLGEASEALALLLAAMPTMRHPGGRLVKIVAHYESGATQTIDGEIVTAAIAKAERGDR